MHILSKLRVELIIKQQRYNLQQINCTSENQSFSLGRYYICIHLFTQKYHIISTNQRSFLSYFIKPKTHYFCSLQCKV